MMYKKDSWGAPCKALAINLTLFLGATLFWCLPSYFSEPFVLFLFVFRVFFFFGACMPSMLLSKALCAILFSFIIYFCFFLATFWSLWCLFFIVSKLYFSMPSHAIFGPFQCVSSIYYSA